MKLRSKLLIAGLTGAMLTGLASGPVGASPGEYRDDERYGQRGPLPFEAYDQNGDGALTSDEFRDVRAARMKYRAEQGYAMRRAAQAPSFEQIDTDADGLISREELQSHQAERMRRR